MILKLNILKLVAFCMIIMLPNLGSASSIDSLKQVINTSSEDAELIETYKNIFLAYQGDNIDSSIHYGRIALELAKEKELKDLYADMLLQMGHLKTNMGELEKSKDYLDEAMKVSSEIKDTVRMISVLNSLGKLNYRMERNDLSMKNLYKAFDWAVEIDDDKSIVQSTNSLGIMSAVNKNYTDAINYFELTVKRAEKNGDSELATKAKLNIAMAHKELENLDKALTGFQDLLQDETLVHSEQNIGRMHFNIGAILLDKNETEQAMFHINKAITTAQKLKLGYLKELALYKRSHIYFGRGELQKAKDDATKGLQIAIQIKRGPTSELKYYSLLADISEALSNFKQAFLYQEKYSMLTDSVSLLGRQAEIDQLEIRFQTKQKELENINLKQEKANQELTIQRRTGMGLAAGSLVLLLLFLGYTLFQNHQKTLDMNNILEGKVKSRTEELESSNKLLQHSNEELRRFAFISSHDLKEPLRNIGSFVTLIKRKLHKRDDADMIDYIEIVENSNHQMANLVNSILEYSKLEDVKDLKLEKVELNKEIERIEDLMNRSFEDKNISITRDDLPNILFNASTVRVIMKNLIENAVKYNDHAEVKINIAHKLNKDQITIYVKDNGMGIPKEYQEKIFEMFTRLNNRTRYSGSGMGLAYCKKLLNFYKGSIKVESAEGKGSTFIISFPAKHLVPSQAVIIA